MTDTAIVFCILSAPVVLAGFMIVKACQAILARRCEVCGKRAVESVQDTRQVEDGPGEWELWRPDGKPHWLCADHMRDGRMKRDSRVQKRTA